MTNTIRFIEETMETCSPNELVEFRYFEDIINDAYGEEQMIGKLFNIFSSLSIFIAILGLFGLASFTTEQRTKEIGIRKVLGASVPNILGLLSKGFLKWVMIASIISWPVAYYFINKWLQKFSYRVHLSIWIFLLSGFAALVIALLTVSFQTIKAATANPVDSLRYE